MEQIHSLAVDQVLKHLVLWNMYIDMLTMHDKWCDSVNELMNRHIMLGNSRMGRFLIAATIAGSLLRFVLVLVRYVYFSIGQDSLTIMIHS
jgi:hypothetical protein